MKVLLELTGNMGMSKTLLLTFMVIICMCRTTLAQTKLDSSNIPLTFDFQETTIEQFHNNFHSPYQGQNSFLPRERPALSLTSDFCFNISFPKLFDIDFNPELSGGRGLSGTYGIAGFPNGEVYRVGTPEPVISIARLYIDKTFPLPTSTSDSAGARLNVVIGKFSITDYFDNNDYSNSARTQFMNWAIMNNGAWDYPADTRGYTDGFVIQYLMDNFALRFAAVLEPTTANGPNLDWHILKAHGEALEGRYGYNAFGHDGTFRLDLYLNTARMGNYYEATYDPIYNHDITLTEKYSRDKYGFGVNVGQSLSPYAGAFLRIGWNDGQNETWAYTEIDRTISGGVTTKLPIFGRPDDNFGIAFDINGISATHRAYLASSGYGFMLGDGKLPHHGLEQILETYYLFQLNRMLAISFDYQYVVNPGYNQDRGPVNIGGVRVHFEI